MEWKSILIPLIIKALTENDLIDVLKSLGRKQKKVLLTGTTGVGKTLFIDSLIKDIVEAIPRSERTQAIIKTKRRDKHIRYVLIDTPGGHSNFIFTSKKIIDLILEKRPVVINITSYGYHEYDLLKKEISKNVFLSTDKNIINKKYLENHRELEYKRLLEWKNFFQIINPSWFITVMTKADLWWNDKEECLEYYKKGKYANIFKDLKDSQHICLPYCSIINKFYDVKPHTDFDETNKNELKNGFMKSFKEILET